MKNSSSRAEIVAKTSMHNFTVSNDVVRKSGMLWYIEATDIKIVHAPTWKLWNPLVEVKDKLPSRDFPGLVYAIACHDRDNQYIGETGNQGKS